MLMPHLRSVGFIALFASSLGAQTTTGIGAGVVVPVGELGRIDAVGYHVAGHWQSIPPLRSLGFRVDASFSAMGRKQTIQDISERILSVTAGPVVRFPRIGVSYGYATATAGAYNQSTSPQPTGAAASTSLGLGAGLGWRFSIGKRSAFTEARYHQISGGPRFVPVSFGLLF